MYAQSEFSKNLKKLRKLYNISQTDLAGELGYGYTAISNYETGRNEPAIKDLIRIARRFHVSVDYLIGNTSSCYDKTIYKDKDLNYLLNQVYPQLNSYERYIVMSLIAAIQQSKKLLKERQIDKFMMRGKKKE